MYSKLIPGSQTRLIHKITDPVTGESFYPDIFYKHPFAEGERCDKDLYRELLDLSRDPSAPPFLILEVAPKEEAAASKYRTAWEEAVRTQQTGQTDVFHSDELSELTAFAEELMLSATMKQGFLQLFSYHRLCGGDYRELLSPFREEYALPVKTKNEGKMIYERIKNLILG